MGTHLFGSPWLHALLVQHLRNGIFSTYGFAWSNITNSLDAKKTEKLIKIYRFCRAEEDNQ